MAKWIKFNDLGLSKSEKTQIWEVVTLEGGVIGHIKWYGQWRKYGFFPGAATVFENDCLKDIAEFLQKVTNEKKQKALSRQ